MKISKTTYSYLFIKIIKIFNVFIVEYEIHIFFRWQILIYFFMKIKIYVFSRWSLFENSDIYLIMELNNKKKNRLYIVYEHYNFSQMTNFGIIKNLKYINLLEIRNYLKTYNKFFLSCTNIYIYFFLDYITFKFQNY